MLIVNRHKNDAVYYGTHEMLSHVDNCAWYAKNKDSAEDYIEAATCVDVLPFAIPADWPDYKGKVLYISESTNFYKNTYKFESDDGSSKFSVSIVRYFTNRHNGQVMQKHQCFLLGSKNGKIISICKNKKTFIW